MYVDLALCVKQLHTFATLCMSYGVVFALLIVAEVVERC